jgi:hypothetical protein
MADISKFGVNALYVPEGLELRSSGKFLFAHNEGTLSQSPAGDLPHSHPEGSGSHKPDSCRQPQETPDRSMLTRLSEEV